jgi:DNA-binding winged helix-turn-helix (wHTH) protein
VDAWNVREVTERVRIGTQLLDQASLAQEVAGMADSPIRWEPDTSALPVQGADGTLLAVVPIPGTGTSLAIVGYPVTAPGAELKAPGALAEGRTGLLLDHEQRRVWVDGREIALTFQEFELLAYLSAHPSTVFSRADLVQQVWQRDFAADSRTVDVHISRLRHKLGAEYGKCLVTEYRVGYQYRPAAGTGSASPTAPGTSGPASLGVPVAVRQAGAESAAAG